MHFPQRNSRYWQILHTLRAGPLTIWQGIEQHGEFATAARPHGISFEEILSLYCRLIDWGCLIRDGIFYRLTTRARTQLDGLVQPRPTTSIAAPREDWAKRAIPWTHRHERSGRYRQLNYTIPVFAGQPAPAQSMPAQSLPVQSTL